MTNMAAKSNIIYDIKPWDDSVDIAEIEKKVQFVTDRIQRNGK